MRLAEGTVHETSGRDSAGDQRKGQCRRLAEGTVQETSGRDSA